MRLFLIWGKSSDQQTLTKILAGLISRGHEVVYCVGPDGYAPQQEFPNTVFEGHVEAWDDLNLLAEDHFKYPPAESGLIETMRKAESIVLSMMNKRRKGKNVSERRHYYYNKLGYWNGVIKAYRPEAIVFPIIPHKSYQFIIHQLAINYGIKVVSFQQTVVSDRLMFYGDFWQGSNAMQREIQKNAGQNFKLQDLSRDLQDYWNKYTDPNFDRTPGYMHEWKNRYQLAKKILRKAKIVFKSLVDLTIFKKLDGYLKKILGDNIKKEYHELQQAPDFGENYVYLPLHFQPERTTCPQGDMFNDQILMAETLSAALPDDWFLFIKEHPVQWLPTGLNFSDMRYRGYYRRLARLPKVKLVPVETDTFKLTEKAKAVVAIAGTAGWEAIMNLKPVLSFGYPWYADFPFVYKIDSADACRNAIAEIAAGRAEFGQQQIINYLKSFERATLRDAYYLGGRVENSNLSETESINNIVEIIDWQLKNSNQTIDYAFTA